MVLLRTIKTSGLYSYGEKVDLTFSDHNVIVGPNNSGKSNLFRMIKLLVDTFTTNRYVQDWETFAKTEDIFLEVRLTLSRDEVEHIVDYLSYFNEGPNRWVQYRKFSNRNFLYDNLDLLRMKISWVPQVQGGGSAPIFEFEFERLGLRMYAEGFHGPVLASSSKPHRGGYSVENEISFPEFLDSIASNTDAKEYVKTALSSLGDKVLVIQEVTPSLATDMSTEGKLTIKKLHQFMGWELGKNHYVTFIRVIGRILEHNIHFTTERRSFSKSPLEYARQMAEGEDEEFMKKIMALASTQSMRYEDHLEDDGSNLAQFLFSLKESQKFEERQRFSEIKQAFESVVRSEQLTFDVHLEYERRSTGPRFGDEQMDPKTPTLVIIDMALGIQYPLDQVGSGIGEVLYLLTLSYGTKNSLVLLDEPSVNLHPPLMKSLMRLMEDERNKNQFVIITHSPELLHYELFDGKASIFYVKKTDHVSKVRSLDKELKQWFEENKSRFRHQIDTRIFFGKCVILTEGESERNLLGLASYLSSVDADLDLVGHDVVVTSVGGKNNFAKNMKYLDSFGIQYVVLADSDARTLFESFGTLSKGSLIAKGPVFIIENGDFEQLMKDIDSDAYHTAERQFRGSKPTIAFEFAKSMAERNPKALDTIRAFLQAAIGKTQ